MSKYLPKRIVPLRMARSGQRLSGCVALREMCRLGASLSNDEGDVQVELSFGEDEEGTLCVRGEVRATLELICQRCLQPVQILVNPAVSLALVSAGETDKVDRQFEPLTADNQAVRVADLVEDELILALPLVPMHDHTQCAIPQRYGVPDGAESEESDNPFSVLSTLKPKS